MNESWSPVALCADIERGTSAGTRLNGEELVVWRDASGVAHVWEDRCPHRGMRLSFGFVRGDHLACLYHGWQFDGGGACRHIPAHPALRVPSTIHAHTYAVTERLGVIWTSREDAAPVCADEPALAVRSLDLAADAARVSTALLDVPPPLGEPGAPNLQGPLMLLTGSSGRLAVAVQPLAAGETMLHLALLGVPDPALRRPVADWAQALRGRLETGV